MLANAQVPACVSSNWQCGVKGVRHRLIFAYLNDFLALAGLIPAVAGRGQNTGGKPIPRPAPILLLEFGSVDAGLELGVFSEQVEQVGAVDEFDRFAGRELIRGRAVAAGGDEDTLGGSFVL